MKTAIMPRKATLRRVLSILLALCVLVMFFTGCKKDEPVEPIKPPPVDTSYTLKLYDANVLIFMDTVYKKVGDMFDFSWQYQGEKSFEILLDGDHYSFEKTGKQSILVEKQRVFNFKVDGKKVRSQVIILIQEVNLPEITLSANPQRGGPGVFNIGVILTDAKSATSTLPSFTGVSGTFSTPHLTATTTYSFTAVNDDGTVTKDITITIDPPVGPDSTDLLVLDYWVNDSVWFFINDTWKYQYFAQNGERTVYTRDGHIYGYNPTSYGLWWWSGGYLMGAYQNTVKLLDSTAMILERGEFCENCPGYVIQVRRKYIHENHK